MWAKAVLPTDSCMTDLRQTQMPLSALPLAVSIQCSGGILLFAFIIFFLALYTAKVLTVRGRRVQLGLWDTAGAERFQSLTKLYYKNAQAALVCWDMNDMNSFSKCRFWIREISSNEPNCAIVLVGTK